MVDKKRIFENPNFVDPEGNTFYLRHEVEGKSITTYLDEEVAGVMINLNEKEIESNIKYFLENGCKEIV